MLRNLKFEQSDVTPACLSDLELELLATASSKNQMLPRYYHVEGEASMRQFNPVIIDLNRAISLRKRDHNSLEDKQRLDSWLYTFSNLGDGQAPERSYRWQREGKRTKKGVCNRELICELVAGSDGILETWGNSPNTAAEYRRRTREAELSRVQKVIANRSNGLTVIEGGGLPPLWDSSTSTENPVEGYAARGRPPSHVEMVRRLNPGLDVNRRSASYAVRTGSLARKPVKVKNIEALAPVDGQLPLVEPQQVQLWTAPSLRLEVDARLRKDARKAGREARLQLIRCDRLKRIDEREWVKMARRMEGRKDMLELELRRADCAAGNNPHDNAASAYWFSWWQCPDIMRKAAGQNPHNRTVPTAQQVIDFLTVAPMPDARVLELEGDWKNSHYWNSLTYTREDERLNAWLLTRLTAGDRHVWPMPDRNTQTPNEVRLAALLRSYDQGNIPHSLEAYRLAKSSLIKLVNNPIRKFTLIGTPYGNAKRKSFTLDRRYRQEGTVNHHLKGLPPEGGVFTGNFVEQTGVDRLPQLTEMEWDHLTRTEWSSVDTYIAGLIQTFRHTDWVYCLIAKYSTKASNDATGTLIA